MCRLCEIKKESTSVLGPVPEDVFKMVDFFAKEQGWDWDKHTLAENIQWSTWILFMEGYISIAVSWAPDASTKYHSKFEHEAQLSVSIIPLDSLSEIDPEEFMKLAGKDTKESIKYLVDKLGLDGRVNVDSVTEMMSEYGLEVVAPESDSSDGEPS